MSLLFAGKPHANVMHPSCGDAMFLRRQDVVDKFEANFREMEDGQLLFQPPRAKIGVPITWDEYADVMARFERYHIIHMLANLAVFICGGAFGLYYLIFEGRFIPFVFAFVIAFTFSVALQVRDSVGLLLPFVKRRDEMLKTFNHERDAVL
ncbi:MAG: hypothetical protein EON59_15925 [Alphaproteobacteria bacterium]|nr:MAG: hypothetical protein EON59_15925 [Alphaproteobacteria bacterium]